MAPKHAKIKKVVTAAAAAMLLFSGGGAPDSNLQVIVYGVVDGLKFRAFAPEPEYSAEHPPKVDRETSIHEDMMEADVQEAVGSNSLLMGPDYVYKHGSLALDYVYEDEDLIDDVALSVIEDIKAWNTTTTALHIITVPTWLCHLSLGNKELPEYIWFNDVKKKLEAMYPANPRVVARKLTDAMSIRARNGVIVARVYRLFCSLRRILDGKKAPWSKQDATSVVDIIWELFDMGASRIVCEFLEREELQDPDFKVPFEESLKSLPPKHSRREIANLLQSSADLMMHWDHLHLEDEQYPEEYPVRK